MASYNLVIPHQYNIDQWFSIINDAMYYAENHRNIKKLIIDFRNVHFIDTDRFVTLACLIEVFYQKGCEIIFPEEFKGIQAVERHLDNIKFKNYWTEGFDRESYTMPFNSSTFGLWKISESMIYSYSQRAREYVERLFGDNRDMIPLASNMDEVFNNIFDHSQSPVSGYIISQFYPTTNMLCFSVCDFGVGIPQAIKDSGKNLNINDSEAIFKSLEHGFSIKSTPQNRGFGLNNILELTESSNGRLIITSNNGVVYKKAGHNPLLSNKDYNFQGTLVRVEVDLNTFEEKEESEEIYDF